MEGGGGKGQGEGGGGYLEVRSWVEGQTQHLTYSRLKGISTL